MWFKINLKFKESKIFRSDVMYVITFPQNERMTPKADNILFRVYDLIF